MRQKSNITSVSCLGWEARIRGRLKRLGDVSWIEASQVKEKKHFIDQVQAGLGGPPISAKITKKKP